ncbi:MAG: hypothetical protein ACYC9D_12830 [Candidatus Dormibacteria bacterium]
MEILTRKLGPLPGWGWIVVGGGIFVVWKLMGGKLPGGASTSSGAGAPPAGVASDGSVMAEPLGQQALGMISSLAADMDALAQHDQLVGSTGTSPAGSINPKMTPGTGSVPAGQNPFTPFTIDPGGPKPQSGFLASVVNAARNPPPRPNQPAPSPASSPAYQQWATQYLGYNNAVPGYKNPGSPPAGFAAPAPGANLAGVGTVQPNTYVPTWLRSSYGRRGASGWGH